MATTTLLHKISQIMEIIMENKTGLHGNNNDIKQDITNNNGNTTNDNSVQNVYNITQNFNFYQKDLANNVALRDENMKAITEGAKGYIKEYIQNGSECTTNKTPEEKREFALNFRRFAENTTDEDLRKIWEQILAGEITGKGNTSVRTMDVVSKLSKKEAELFNIP